MYTVHVISLNIDGGASAPVGPSVAMPLTTATCMKCTAQDESRITNIALGEAECYICLEALIKSCILSYKQSGSVLLCFTLTKVPSKCISLVILTLSLNKYTISFNKMCQ